MRNGGAIGLVEVSTEVVADASFLSGAYHPSDIPTVRQSGGVLVRVAGDA